MKFQVLLPTAILTFAIPFNLGCQIADSQIVKGNDNKVANSENDKWAKEKVLLSSIIDGIEKKLEESDWKTESKVVRKPPEYSTQHTYTRLESKATDKRVSIEINLSESSIDWYDRGVETIPRGTVKKLPSIGDRAVSISDDYDPSGQVRFTVKNYYVIIYANRPKYAEEVAQIVKKQITEAEN